MQNLRKYWHIVRLRFSGSPSDDPAPPALRHLEAHYPEFSHQDPLDDRALQTLLMQEVRQASALAALSLRCYISHTILTVCKLLVSTYHERHGVELTVLTSYLLTDDGELPILIQNQQGKLSIQRPLTPQEDPQKTSTIFQPIAYKILEKFDPNKSALSTWASKLTRQSSELKQVLKEEYGILLITDWALLNDTTPNAFRKILINYYHYSEQPEANCQALDAQVAILTAYQQVYRKYHPPAPGKTCQPPTLEQCQEMISILGSADRDPQTFLDEKLYPIAQQIRNYRLHRPPLAKSESQSTNAAESQFSGIFDNYLKGAVAAAIAAKVTQPNSTATQQANQRRCLTALYYLYQVGLSQSEIAKKLGFSGQDRVSKLLKLKDFYASLKFHMLVMLKKEIPEIASACDHPDHLLKIETAISEYLAPLAEEDKKWNSTPLEKRQQPSQLGRWICECLTQYSIE
jgi:AraC-like DNA-binding protein